MIEPCIDCQEIQKTRFQIDGLALVVQKQKLDIEQVQQTQQNKDIEHEQMIQNLTTRMDTMSQDLVDFKKEVKQDIASIKKDIPDMFDNAVNKLLAKMFKYFLIGVLILAGVIILALSRPVILKGINEIYTWVESVEVPNGN